MHDVLKRNTAYCSQHKSRLRDIRLPWYWQLLQRKYLLLASGTGWHLWIFTYFKTPLKVSVMTSLLLSVLLSFMAWFAITVGALIAKFEHIKPRWIKVSFWHTVIRFSADTLLLAVAWVSILWGFLISNRCGFVRLLPVGWASWHLIYYYWS